MKHVWKRYLIVTAMTVVLGLSAGCGSAAEDTNNNQNNTQDENTPDGNENKNNTDGSQVPAGDNNGTSPDTNTDMNNDGTNGTNNNMNGATSGEGTVDENGNRTYYANAAVRQLHPFKRKPELPLKIPRLHRMGSRAVNQKISQGAAIPAVIQQSQHLFKGLTALRERKFRPLLL